MGLHKNVSMTVIRRLPKYYRFLSDLLESGTIRISSKELSSLMGITASQIRQDLNCFGGFGQQGYGYNVEYLFKEIHNILGLTNNFNVIIIGAGNLGRALANYNNFSKRGYNIIGIFDLNENLIGTKLNKLEILNVNCLSDFTKTHSVDIAVICVHQKNTISVAENIIQLGIKAIWNFSPFELNLSTTDVIIENVHLSDSLMVLGYRLSQLNIGNL